MRYFPKTLFCTIRNLIEMLTRQIPSQPTRVGTWRVVLALMFRSMARVVVPVGLVSVSVWRPWPTPRSRRTCPIRSQRRIR